MMIMILIINESVKEIDDDNEITNQWKCDDDDQPSWSYGMLILQRRHYADKLHQQTGTVSPRNI